MVWFYVKGKRQLVTLPAFYSFFYASLQYILDDVSFES